MVGPGIRGFQSIQELNLGSDSRDRLKECEEKVRRRTTETDGHLEPRGKRAAAKPRHVQCPMNVMLYEESDG